jgi:hypothetical protein
LDSEPTKGFAAPLHGDLDRGAEAIRGQRVGLDAIEPDRAGMVNLGGDRERLFVNEDPVSMGRRTRPFGELLNQVG